MAYFFGPPCVSPSFLPILRRTLCSCSSLISKVEVVGFETCGFICMTMQIFSLIKFCLASANIDRVSPNFRGTFYQVSLQSSQKIEVLTTKLKKINHCGAIRRHFIDIVQIPSMSNTCTGWPQKVSHYQMYRKIVLSRIRFIR